LSELTLFLGRFHPLLVHLPIGFLVLAGLLELLARRPGFAATRPVMGPVLTLSAASAVAAAGAGLLLGSGGDYAGPSYTWHKWLGLALAAMCCVAAGTWHAHRRFGGASKRLGDRAALAASVSLLVVAGHFGSTLTHGEGYLTEHAPWRGQAGTAPAGVTRPARDVVAYTEAVAPILGRRCSDCHGADKSEGGLRLDSPDGLRHGGESGPVVMTSDADRSELMRRVSLPRGHADAMPPAGHPALSVADATVLRWWIETGASFEVTLEDVETPPHVLEILEARLGPIERGGPAILATEAPSADPAVIADVEALGASVSPLADDTGWLSIHCTNAGPAFGDDDLHEVAALAGSVTWLDLSGTAVTDEGLQALKAFTNLTRLRLDRTGISDAGLTHLAGLERLEYLNLHSTAVSDTGIARLESLPALRSLYLWRTSVTARGAERLRSANPRLAVDLGQTDNVERRPAS
jgi:mono/diheme cytochrome c family protein